jgi:hypothetical protein
VNRLIFIGLVFFFLGSNTVFSQKKTDDAVLVAKDTLKSNNIDPLTPAKAAFYSAILPGLGQAYNKKYWKIPIVYGAIGVSLYYYLDSKKNYNAYRDEYKRRLAGLGRSEDYKKYDDNTLIKAQDFYQRNQSLSAFFVIGFYALNIIDANVDAALMQFNVNDNLSFKPNVYFNDASLKSNVGLILNYNF